MTELKNKNNKPKIVKGSHLTVKTWPDGHTELEWDWDALMRDVRNAIGLVEGKQDSAVTEAKVKKTRQKKSVDTKDKTK